jgi:type I restriction enzyme M protein
MSSVSFQSLSNFIWSVADLLRGPYRPPQYERVMLPMTVLRRFDCVLASSKAAVLKKHGQLEAVGKIKNVDATLNAFAKDRHGESLGFHNHSPLDFKLLKGDPDNVGRHLLDYINGFSENIRRWIIENDWLEAIVALPEQMFYNTGIGTFIWVVSNRKTKNRQGKIQLIDSRDRWQPMKRSLGDKRRYLDRDIIDVLTKEHGEFAESETSKIFDNYDFGYRRITVERPLRLRFQVTDEAKEIFLNSCPDLYDPVMEMILALGYEPDFNWNDVWLRVQQIFKDCEVGWAAGAKGSNQKKFFRDCFTEIDPEAVPVIAKWGSAAGVVDATDFPNQVIPKDLKPVELDGIFGVYPDPYGKKGKTVEYEADSSLRDNENVPLNEGIISFFIREVIPFVGDAWINFDKKLRDDIDTGIGEVGYEINFNYAFFKEQSPRDLKSIDDELAEVEARILSMLQAVTR